MDIIEATTLARQLMNEHGLTDWKFDFDRAKRRFGACHYNKKMITLSLPLVLRNDKEVIEDVIKHEIAHALVGFAAAHDYRWRNMARSLGANPKAIYDSDTVAEVEGKWVAVCPVHGKLSGPRHRRTKHRVCKFCHHPVEWKEL